MTNFVMKVKRFIFYKIIDEAKHAISF